MSDVFIRTSQRKGESDLLDLSTTEQVFQIAEVFSKGGEVFGSAENFQDWMKAENVSLGDKRPMELLASRDGAQMILDVIGRIECGIFS